MSRRALRRDPAARDSGLTLVELVVASALLGLVISVIGGIMISLLTTERSVTGLTEGATSAQLTATTIGDQLRNSSGFQLVEVDDPDDQLLVARVAGSASDLTWRCVGWYVDTSGDGQIRTTTTADGVAIDPPPTAELDDWTLLLDGVSAPDGLTVFTEAGPRMEVRFDAMTEDDGLPVAIRFTSARLTGVEEGESCFP